MTVRGSLLASVAELRRRRPGQARAMTDQRIAAFFSGPIHVKQQTEDQARRPRLFGRAGHLDHSQVAADDLRRGSRDLHRRPRPGRGAGAGAAQGGDARHQAGAHFHRGPARGIRARLRVPDVPRQRAIRGPVPARHLDRPAAHRQTPGRDRPRGRRRRDRPRRDRQGQRPGAVRAFGLCARTRHQDHRALAGMELRLSHGAHRLRRAAPDPDRQGQARRSAVLDRRQPSARLLRGQGARGSGRRDAALRLFAHASIRSRPPTSRPSSKSRSRRAIRSRSTARR